MLGLKLNHVSKRGYWNIFQYFIVPNLSRGLFRLCSEIRLEGLSWQIRLCGNTWLNIEFLHEMIIQSLTIINFSLNPHAATGTELSAYNLTIYDYKSISRLTRKSRYPCYFLNGYFLNGKMLLPPMKFTIYANVGR